MKHTKPWFLQERLIFGLVAMLCLFGLFSWFNINEQEDPFFPYRNGHVTLVAPGMSTNAIEDTIVQPFERLLADIDGLARVSAKVSDGWATVDIELAETIYDTESAWQRVREKVAQAQSQFSDLVSTFELNDRAQDTAGILLAIETEQSLIQTRRYALYLKDELYKMAAIRKIDIIGDSGEQIEVFYPQQKMLQYGISPLDIANQINQANGLNQTGQLESQHYRSNIGSITRLENITQVKDVQIKTPDGQLMALSDIAQVGISTALPQSSSFWINGRQSIGLSITVPPNQLRVTQFGENLMARIDEINSRSSLFKVTPVFFQPTWTQNRRDDLAMSLLYSSIGVGLVLFLLMSRKVALVVTLTIPAIALSTIAVFGISGGVLHQMSIAGLVISLGLMVDNSIVMSELISRYRQAGLNRIEASKKAIKDLYKPLATSTFTTIAAFIPMLLSKGNVADFIRMIPVMVIIAIIISYFYSLALLSALTNNLKRFKEGSGSARFAQQGQLMARLGAQYPKTVISGFLLLCVFTLTLTQSEQGEFFPKSNRNQAYIDVEGSFGLSHSATLQTVKAIEGMLSQQSEITKVVSFAGNSGPSFYYNLSQSPNEPHIARIVFETHSSEQIPTLVSRLNQTFTEQFSGVRIRAREIGQGPPVESPVEIRVLGDDRKQLLGASEAIYQLLLAHPNAVDTRRDYMLGKPKLNFDIDTYNLNHAGIERKDLSSFIAWRTSGLTVTDIPSERESLPIVLRDSRNIVNVDAEHISNTVVLNQKGQSYPLSLFAEPRFDGEAPVLHRWKGFNVHVIKSDLQADFDAGQFLAGLDGQLNEIATDFGVTLEFGGEAQEQSESNQALLSTLPIGAILLFGALILQFNSYRIAALIMLTIPLAMIGVKPTLSLVGVTFGFMSVLGLLALTGIVVNTAIILIDNVLLKIRNEQLSLIQAIEQATKERFRPVLLTACTTIIGMIPLTSPTSPLWPPMAWTIIGGLVTSTVLTLIVLPAFLSLVLNEAKIRGESV